MAPSTGKSTICTQVDSGSQKISTEILVGWPQNTQTKENQRPPVYNAEDYIVSLKKFGRRTTGASNGVPKSIYDTSEEKNANKRAATLPTNNSILKSSMQTFTDEECEMTLKQFGSITDLLTKLRSDLRSSFQSFVQEFVAVPLDGTSSLLEVLRSIQLSQQNGTTQTKTTEKVNGQTYQRRALLDELACLQCLHLCCTRSSEAGLRIGLSPIGLMPLAASATGQGIRSRIISLQLLTTACDKHAAGHRSQKNVYSGHIAVSEALSTLRLRCGEPVRFRLLAGMLNSGGGSGELQYYGLKFINTFLESAENMQNRLYLQAELCQAGFDPQNLTKIISSSSPWYEKLNAEIKYFEEIKIDVGKLMLQSRESEKMRGQMTALQRRIQILQEEKTVLTTMERRLQERCAELQREVFRLQGAQNNEGYRSLEKCPVALPRQVLPRASKNGSSEHDDEGISSSETGQSLSPEPILILPQNTSKKFSSNFNECTNYNTGVKDDDMNTTIEEVIEELENIVHDAELEIKSSKIGKTKISAELIPYHQHLRTLSPENLEREIVPVNLLPQPPKKSRSLGQLLSSGSEFDDSDYGVLMANNVSRISYYDDIELEIAHSREHGCRIESDGGTNLDLINQTSTNRELLNVIMDARDKDDNIFMTAPARNSSGINKAENQSLIPKEAQTPQKFNGVFFMTEMSTPAKYPKPDITAALEARRVTKSIERIESYGSGGLGSMIDIIMTPEKKQEKKNVNSKAINNFTTLRDMSMNTTFLLRNKSPAPENPTHVFPSGAKKTRTISGSKLTDLPSGLY